MRESERERERVRAIFNHRLKITYSGYCVPPNSLATWNIHWAVLPSRAPDAQLALLVAAPALDPATGDYRARVIYPRGDGDGGDAWKGREMEGKGVQEGTGEEEGSKLPPRPRRTTSPATTPGLANHSTSPPNNLPYRHTSSPSGHTCIAIHPRAGATEGVNEGGDRERREGIMRRWILA